MTQQQNNKRNPARRGVTLIEIAIVLVIIGILLGGVLKGQELINNARIRNLTNQQNGIRIAWHAFNAKFGAMPADFPYAQQYIRGAAAPESAGNAQTGDGRIHLLESPVALFQMAAVGFLKCQQCTQPTSKAPSPLNSLLNPYGGVVAIFHDGYLGTAPGGGALPVIAFYAARVANAGDRTIRLMTHSGWAIPSNIAAEVDKKIDDGIANTGEVVFNNYYISSSGSTQTPQYWSCMSDSAEKQSNPAAVVSSDLLWWRHASEDPVANCGLSLDL